MSLDNSLNKILIVDFGSQFTQLIARRIRELGVFSDIVSHKKIKLNQINQSVKGIILSGGPLNVYQINKYSFDKKILKLNIPVLGICFGHQIISKFYGGHVKSSKTREFGFAKIKKSKNSILTKNFFDKKEIPYEDIMVDQDPEQLQTMMEKSQRQSVPQIFIGDYHVGGFDDLIEHDMDGKLEDLLKD